MTTPTASSAAYKLHQLLHNHPAPRTHGHRWVVLNYTSCIFGTVTLREDFPIRSRPNEFGYMLTFSDGSMFGAQVKDNLWTAFHTIPITELETVQ